jgi:hypothetical protein
MNTTSERVKKKTVNASNSAMASIGQTLLPTSAARSTDFGCQHYERRSVSGNTRLATVSLIRATMGR